MAAPQQPRSVTIVADLGLKSDPNMHRAHSGSFRVRIEARHEWVESRIFPEADLRKDQCPGTMRMRRVLRDRMACGSKESDPPFPFPPRESRGGDGSPHAAARSAPAKTAGTAHAAAPPARGLRPLARSPSPTSAEARLPLVGPGGKMIARGKELRMAATSSLTFTTFS
jgi:hypothetical protein